MKGLIPVMSSLLAFASALLPPNIVFVLTDDQDVVLEGLTPLEKTRKLIGNEGITFANAFATTPLCCPSRSSILTGLYMHSHGTVNNSLSGGCNNRRWQEHEGETFGAVLSRAGYKTFYAGKYLNQYGHEHSGGIAHVPPGWDWWIGLVGNSVYYNYTLSVNGSAVHRGEEEFDYLTDVLKEYSLEFLKNAQSPFLMVICPPSPHEPFTPAKRHKGKFSGLKAPRTPSFNFLVNDTKHWLLRQPPHALPKEIIDKVDKIFRNRWESLLSVDELVQDVIFKLREIRALDNTYVMLSSDHGFHMGQFGLPWDKRQPYETDVRVPLMLRGPGLFKKTILHPVLNVDLASSILDMAKIPSEGFGDGKSFLPLTNAIPGGQERRSFLIEYHGEGSPTEASARACNDDPKVKLCTPESLCKCLDAKNNTFTCLRRFSAEANDVYCEFEDDESFKEFYDLKIDPNQVYNLAGSANTNIQAQVLQCCRRMSKLKKAVGKCFDL